MKVFAVLPAVILPSVAIIALGLLAYTIHERTLPKVPAPPHTWWTEGDTSGPDLISDDGTTIAATVGSEVWLFQCGNVTKKFKTWKDAQEAAAECGIEYEKERAISK
jgi:hypothetical protein